MKSLHLLFASLLLLAACALPRAAQAREFTLEQVLSSPFPSDLFAAGVDIDGVHDWSQRISGASWIDYSSRDAQKVALEASPVGSVQKWRSPVLLIHGDDDRNVSFSQTVDLARRLREQNVEFEQIVFPDDVHDFLLHRHWLRAYAAAADFFDRKLKGQKR
jgi:dipeptidyl aminopeptidase/acylaminoacyl peptidase